MPNFKIAHLSDLHLTATDDGFRFEPQWNARLSGMNDAFRRIVMSDAVRESDLLLFTGDITDRGDARAWKIFSDTIIEGRLATKTLAVLGNHDVCGLGARLGWPTRLRKADLERARGGLELAGQPFRYPWARLVDPRVVIMGLDTNNSGNLTALDNAVGRVGTDQLQRFAELLAKHKDVPVKIVALHHSPNIPERATALRRGYSPPSLVYRWAHQIPLPDRKTFRLLCLAAKVRLVIHGHLHHAEDRRVNGLRIIGAPATTEPTDLSAADKNYRFFQYTVHGEGGCRLNVNLVTV